MATGSAEAAPGVPYAVSQAFPTVVPGSSKKSSNPQWLYKAPPGVGAASMGKCGQIKVDGEYVNHVEKEHL